MNFFNKEFKSKKKSFFFFFFFDGGVAGTYGWTDEQA